MNSRLRAGSFTRRRALTATAIGGAVLAGAGLGERSRRTVAQRSAISSAGGIAGGGLIEGPDASVHFSLFGNGLPLGEDEAMIFSGQVQLADPLIGLRMESVTIDEYGPIDGDDENARQLRGTMRVTMGDTDAESLFVDIALEAEES